MGKSLIITTGGGTDTTDGNPNVTAAQVLQGYTIYAKTDEPITGKMKNISSAYNGLLWPGYDTWISAGYYVGNRKYTAVSLDTQTYATATADQVLNSYKGWNNGALITGSMPNRGAVSSTLAANGTYSVPAGWHNGSGKITQSLSTQGAKTVTPSTSNQTVVAASKWTTGAQIVAGNSNLTANNVKSGVTLFGVIGSYSIYSGDTKRIFYNGESLTGPINHIRFSMTWDDNKTHSYRYSCYVNDESMTNIADIDGYLSGLTGYINDDSESTYLVSTYDKTTYHNNHTAHNKNHMRLSSPLVYIPQVAGKLVNIKLIINYMANSYVDEWAFEEDVFPYDDYRFTVNMGYFPYPPLNTWSSTDRNYFITYQPNKYRSGNYICDPYPKTTNQDVLITPRNYPLENTKNIYENNEKVPLFGAKRNMMSMAYFWLDTQLCDTGDDKYNCSGRGGTIKISEIYVSYQDLPWSASHTWRHRYANDKYEEVIVPKEMEFN